MTAVLLLESLQSPRIEHLRSIITSHEKWQKIQYSAENFVFLVVQGIKDSFFMLYLTYVSYIVIAGLWNFYDVSSNNTKWEYEWSSTRRLATKTVTSRRTSTERPVTAWIAMRKDVTGKEFTLTSWKTEIVKCRRARTTWTLCKRREGEAIPRAAKFGRIDNGRAQSLNWDLRIGKQSPIRYHGTKFGSLEIRDETKLLKADMESFPGIWHKPVKSTMELLKSPLPFKKIWDCWIAVRWIEVTVLCITVAVDQSTVKIGGNDETYRSKSNGIAEKRYAE